MIQLIFARDGESTADSDNRFLGSADTELTSRGKLQAEKLAEYLRKESVDAVYCSRARSARDTADIVTDRKAMNYFPLDELRSRGLGVLDGLVRSEAERLYPEILRKLESLPRTFDIVEMNGERYLDFKKRVKEFLKLVLKRHEGGTILAITHTPVIRMALTILVPPADEDAHLTFAMGETGVTRILTSGKELVIKCVNSQLHLAGIEDILRKKDELEMLLRD
jgi:broad specificity phosphatase PhoE